MRRRSALFRRALLLLLLAIGPLQAQTVLACAMMDTVVPDCCCEEHDTGALLPEAGEAPCCERSVEIRPDNEARQSAAAIKPGDLRSDADPPQALIASFDRLSPPEELFLSLGVLPSIPPAGLAGSDTWLVTQRLRI